MNTGAKVSLIVVTFVALGLFWLQALSGLRGDSEAVTAAEEAADTAEAAIVEAQTVNDEARAAFEAVDGGVKLLTEFTETLPEIAVHEEYPFRRWYEQNLMTPSELRVYNGGSSEETVTFTEPRYWTNNVTCRPDGGVSGEADVDSFSEEGSGGSDRIRFDYCEPMDEPTAIIGVSDAEIELAGWGGDCRLALGWVFSRFMETSVDADGGIVPSGHHLKAWVQPGSFTAQVPQCVDEAALAALRAAMDVRWGTWPVDPEEQAESVERANTAPDTATEDDEEAEELKVVVKFGLVFRPAHPDLCTGSLVGYPDRNEDSEDSAEEDDSDGSESVDLCPARERLLTEAILRAFSGPPISTRVCLPRLPVATLVQNGDLIVASHDDWPNADITQWPDTLDGCDIEPVTPDLSDIIGDILDRNLADSSSSDSGGDSGANSDSGGDSADEVDDAADSGGEPGEDADGSGSDSDIGDSADG